MITINPGICKGCGAKILWIKNENGKAECFDAALRRVLHVESDSLPGGAKFGVGNAGEPWASPAGEWELDMAHLPHFITCPERDQFRKPITKETRP